jgi:hypothetical protein
MQSIHSFVDRLGLRGYVSLKVLVFAVFGLQSIPSSMFSGSIKLESPVGGPGFGIVSLFNCSKLR